MMGAQKRPDDTRIFAAHKHLSYAMDSCAKAVAAHKQQQDVTHLVRESLKSTQKTWAILSDSTQRSQAAWHARSSLLKAKTAVDRAMEKINAALRLTSATSKQTPHITKRERQKIVKKVLQDLMQVLHKTSHATPRLAIEKVLRPILGKGTQIADLSFDIYCPRSYKHHTRLTLWMPRILASGDHVSQALKIGRQMLRACGVKEVDAYVIGINSRVNQYKELHLLMLDFDNMSFEQLPLAKLRTEPGVLLRTESGYHFLGLHLYDVSQWKKRLAGYRRLASAEHIDLSLQRGYGTLRMTASPRKPFAPIVVTAWKGL